ncbi:Plant UBX domain-containing protein 8 [Linum perenne]
MDVFLEHSGDLNAAVNAHFTEGDRSSLNAASIPPHEDDIMDIDDPIETAPGRNPLSLLSDPAIVNPFSLLDPQFRRSFFDGGGSDFVNHAPFVTQPRQVREIPIEVRDSPDVSGRSGHGPVIEDVTGTDYARDSGIRGTVIVSDEENDEVAGQQDRGVLGDTSGEVLRPGAPLPGNSLEYSNDIEEEMVRAAIEASKHEAQVR